VKNASLLLVGCALLAACARPTGWFRADRAPTRDDAYDERFEPIALEPDGPCEPKLERQGDGTHRVIVLVPGIGGDGDEMRQSLPAVMGAQPASVFMFRYGAFEPRDVLVNRLALGISRLAACIPHSAGRLLVLSHSAGGVLSSRAASRVTPPPGAEGEWLTVLTVASPLAGTSRVSAPSSSAGDRPLMLELGVSIPSYPAAVPGVRVVHLRSSAQSDGYMRPSGDHLPNDPAVGVPGAAQLSLPPELDHGAALVYVAKRIGDGTWTEWLASTTASSPAP
jgi:hypothetical protein